MKKKDKGKGGIRMAAGLLLTVCMIFAGALLGGAMTAEAAEQQPALNPAIDFDQKGSITIHKYEYNGTGGTATGKPGDSDNVPTGATPLEGVEFTIYQVRTAEQLKNIYQGTTTTDTMPELSDYFEPDNETLKAGVTLTPYKPDDLTNPGTTDSDGVVEFKNLPVGIYLVVETDAPPKVTTKSAPFLVSIPTTVDNNDWLYNVHVFPKNATTYSEKVELIKKGSDDTPLENVTFELQRQKEDGKWESVTVTNEAGTAVALQTGEDGKITIDRLAPGNYRLIETGIGDNPGYIADFSKIYEFVVKDDGTIGRKNVGDTYIVLKDEGSPAATVATITVINEKPDVDKKVKDKDGSWKQEADYSVGDTISYQVAIKVPENIAKLKKFEVQDTPHGIKYTADSLKVYEAKADGTMDATKEITAAGNYTVTAGTPTDGFTVTFMMTGAIKDQGGKTIYITYSAVLTEGAVSPTGQVNAGNTNTVELIYSKYIKPTTLPDEDFPKPPPEDPEDKIKDTTVVYTFQLDIEKKGKTDGDPIALQGVTFDLYKETTEADPDKLEDTDAGALGLPASKKWKKVNTGLTTDEDGKISVKLAAGTYALVETRTEDGYNLLSKPIVVVLDATHTTKFKEAYPDEDDTGKIIIKNEVEGATITQTITANGDNVTNSVTILNTKGFTLPTTGGAGGFLFAVIGCVVMIVGILLFKGTKKKPESE